MIKLLDFADQNNAVLAGHTSLLQVYRFYNRNYNILCELDRWRSVAIKLIRGENWTLVGGGGGGGGEEGGGGGGGGGGGVRFRVGAPEQRDVKRNESGS